MKNGRPRPAAIGKHGAGRGLGIRWAGASGQATNAVISVSRAWWRARLLIAPRRMMRLTALNFLGVRLMRGKHVTLMDVSSSHLAFGLFGFLASFGFNCDALSGRRVSGLAGTCPP